MLRISSGGITNKGGKVERRKSVRKEEKAVRGQDTTGRLEKGKQRGDDREEGSGEEGSSERLWEVKAVISSRG